MVTLHKPRVMSTTFLGTVSYNDQHVATRYGTDVRATEPVLAARGSRPHCRRRWWPRPRSRRRALNFNFNFTLTLFASDRRNADRLKHLAMTIDASSAPAR